MILTSHALVGAAVSQLTPNQPVTGFLLGFGSHWLLDTIPHWDYQLKSLHKDTVNRLNTYMTFGREFGRDLLFVGSDFTIGLIGAWWLFSVVGQTGWLVILAGALGGMMPDLLQFGYYRFRCEPFVSLQKIHTLVFHSQKKIEDWKWGAPLQVLTVAIIIFLLS